MGGGVTDLSSLSGLPLPLQMAMGYTPGASPDFVLGYNADVDTSEATLWGATNALTYSYPAAALTMSVSSTNAADTATGTGAQAVVVRALDANYNSFDAVLPLSGVSAVAMSTQAIRVNEFSIVSAGSGGTNAGNVYIGVTVATTGVPTTAYGCIPAGQGSAHQAVFTVPANKTALMVGLGGSGVGGTAGTIGWKLQARPFGFPMITVYRADTQNSGGNFVQPFSECPGIFTQKTDIEIRAIGSSNNNIWAASLQMWLVG